MHRCNTFYPLHPPLCRSISSNKFHAAKNFFPTHLFPFYPHNHDTRNYPPPLLTFYKMIQESDHTLEDPKDQPQRRRARTAVDKAWANKTWRAQEPAVDEAVFCFFHFRVVSRLSFCFRHCFFFCFAQFPHPFASLVSCGLTLSVASPFVAMLFSSSRVVKLAVRSGPRTARDGPGRSHKGNPHPRESTPTATHTHEPNVKDQFHH